MTKTLKQKITTKEVIGLLENLNNDEIKQGINYSDSGFKGKNKDGFWATNQTTKKTIQYIQNKYSCSMGKHIVKYNQKRDTHKHKIKLLNKYNNSLKIEFID
ncbi:MAG TPA: hypothetical protein VJ912_01305 [Candidatus Nanoarchaeia archaeon]|nr:hypothetical protein [Candidatus Nanoarchaeia archaeon]